MILLAIQVGSCAAVQEHLTAGRSVEAQSVVCTRPLVLADDVDTTAQVLSGDLTYTGDGSFIRVSGVHRFSIEDASLRRTTAGAMVEVRGARWDAAFITIERSSIVGGGIFLERALNTAIRNTTISESPYGVAAGLWTNGLTIDNVSFWALSGPAILSLSSSQRWTVQDCIFENSSNGQASGFEQIGDGYVMGFNWLRNWHGDVTVGGQPWIKNLRSGGYQIAGNYFGTPGRAPSGLGPGTPIMSITASQGGVIQANRLEGESAAVEFGPGYSWGATFSGNDVMSPQGVVGYVVGFRALGNNNFTDR